MFLRVVLLLTTKVHYSTINRIIVESLTQKTSGSHSDDSYCHYYLKWIESINSFKLTKASIELLNHIELLSTNIPSYNLILGFNEIYRSISSKVFVALVRVKKKPLPRPGPVRPLVYILKKDYQCQDNYEEI